MVVKNPYEAPTGGPIFGKEQEFFSWAREKELALRKALSTEEKEKREQEEKSLAKRMNS